jgi:hypothetical protein
MAQAQLLESLGAIQSNPTNGPDQKILSVYRSAVSTATWVCGLTHPLGMGLHDRMSAIYLRGKKYAQAFEFHTLSLQMSLESLGKNHAITAAYLAKVSYFYTFDFIFNRKSNDIGGNTFESFRTNGRGHRAT